MLCYVWDMISQFDIGMYNCEEFENIYNLLSNLLIRSVRCILKQGMYGEYKNFNETVSTVKGRIDISTSIKNRYFTNRKLVCEFDRYTFDTNYNRIIKSTLNLLIRCDYVQLNLKHELKKLYIYFDGIQTVDIDTFPNLDYSRSNIHYRLALNICYFIYSGLIADNREGRIEFAKFIDESRMSRLYEKFILNFYKKNLSAFKYNIHSPKIFWRVDKNMSTGLEYLPEMRTDIVVEDVEQNLQIIIDAKYYHNNLNINGFGNSKKLISDNMYQIYTYINNSNFDGDIIGMLLYPTTSDELNLKFVIDNNTIAVNTLNLYDSWENIYKSLLDLIQYTINI